MNYIKISLYAFLVLSIVVSPYQAKAQQNVVLNGTFSNGYNSWTIQNYSTYGWEGPFGGSGGCNGSSDYAIISDPNGYGLSSASADLIQTVHIPNCATSATFSFCYGSAYNVSNTADYLEVYLNSSPVATYHSVAGLSWQSAAFTVNNISSFSGSTLTIDFYAYVGDASPNWTKFYVDNVSLVVTTGSLPTTPTISGSSTFCSGSSTTLSVSNYSSCSGCTYSWSNGSSGTTTSVSSTGTYMVTATNSCGTASASASVSSVQPPSSPTFSSPTTGCGSVSVTASSPGSTFRWSGGNNPSSALNSFTSSGTYMVTATNSSNCTASSSVSVTVNPTPNVSINPSTQTGCTGVQISFPASGGASYSWGGQGVSGETSSTATATYTSPGTYQVTVTGNENGCTASATASVTISTQPNAVNFNPTSPSACGSVSVTASSSNCGNCSYHWSNGISTAQTNINTAGTNVYTVTVSGGGNCSVTGMVSATVNQIPSVSINPATQTGCTGQQISFPASGATTYTWNGQSVNGQNNSTATATYSSSGTYTVTATGMENGCSATATASVTINTQPNAVTFNPANPSGCGSVTVTANSSNCGNCTYSWSMGNGSAQNIATIGTNTYPVTVSGGGSCSVTGTVSVTVNPQPAITSVTSSNNNNGIYCQNQSLTLTVNASNATSYTWGGPNVTPSSSPTTTAIPPGSGNTTYTVTATDGNCSATGSVSVSVTAAVTPSVTFIQSPSSVCIDGLHSFTITGNAVNGGNNPSYNWSSGCSGNPNNNTYEVDNISVPCSISCTLTSNADCATLTTATASINVQETIPSPVSLVISIADTNVCITDQAIFNATPTNGGGSPSYSWLINNSPNGSGSPFNHTFSSTGYYSVYCTMTSSLACFTPALAQSNILVINVTGQATPGVVISASATTICAGAVDTFTAFPSIGGNSPSYQWFVNSAPVSGNSSAVFASTTLHNNDAISCIMTSSSSCATTPTATSNTIRVAVDSIVTPHITISANPAGTICTGTPVTYTAISNNGGSNPVYEWLLNGNYKNNNTSSYTNDSVNNHDVVTCVLISNATCTTPDSVTSNSIIETVNSAVTPSVGIVANTDDTICIGTSITFTATPVHGGSTPHYQWSQSGGTVGTDSTSFTTSSLSSGAIISCILTSDAACATTNTAISNSITVTINSSIIPSITIVANPTGTVCPGTTINFTVQSISGGGTSPMYQWQVRPNVGNVGNGSTTYSTSSLSSSNTVVCLLTSSLSCANPTIAISNGITPSFYPLPGNTITPTGTSTICPGDSILLCGPAGNPDYQWSTGASTQCVYVKYAGLYSVTATSVNLCTATASATLAVYSTPAAPNIEQNSDSLYTTTPAVSYQWYLNNQSIPGATTSGYIASQNGSYYVEAIDGNGCPGKSTVIIVNRVGIKELTSVSDFSITPNPSNGKFLISFETAISEDIEIKVLDPIGQIIKTEERVNVTGNYSKEIDLYGAASGIYIIQLVLGDKTLNRKLEISKQ